MVLPLQAQCSVRQFYLHGMHLLYLYMRAALYGCHGLLRRVEMVVIRVVIRAYRISSDGGGAGAAGGALLALLAAWCAPALAHWQTHAVELVGRAMEGLDIELAAGGFGSSSGTGAAAGSGIKSAQLVVAMAVPLFVGLALAQSLMLRAPFLANARQRWYQEHHSKLLSFVDAVLIGDQTDQALVTALRAATEGVFDGQGSAGACGGGSGGGGCAADGGGVGAGGGSCTLELVVVETASSAAAATAANVHLVHLGARHPDSMPVRQRKGWCVPDARSVSW